MANKKSLADMLRNHINEKLEAKFDYSLASNRRSDIENFIEQNKSALDKNQVKVTAIRPSHTRLLDECLKNKGIDPTSLGRNTKKPKFNSDLNPVITPEPQAGLNDTTKNPKEIPNQKIGLNGQPVNVNPDGSVIVPAFDEKAVSATFSAFVLMLKLNCPDLELLSDEEKDSLGKIWLPFFNKYLSDKYAEIVIPVFATAGILLPKIAKARRIKKEKEGQEEKQETKPDKNLQAEADKIKLEALEKERKEKELRENPASQESQKINEMVNQNENMPKLGEVSTTLTKKDGTQVG